MRNLPCIALILLIMPISVFGQEKMWTGREGICLDWAVTWRMTKISDTAYAGIIEQIHNGGSCVSATNAKLTGTVEASLEGTGVTAFVKHSDGNECSYRGSLYPTTNQVKNGL